LFWKDRTGADNALAGFPIPGSEVLELARLVVPTDPQLAVRLEFAYGRQVRVFRA